MEANQEEYTFHSCKSHQTLGELESGLFVEDPIQCPFSLALNARNSLNCVKKIFTLSGVLDIRVDEERVCFREDVFHHNLEPVETTRFGDLNLVGETFNKILVDNAIRGSKES